MASEVEETLKRLVGHKGVVGTVVVNNEGVAIKSTLDNTNVFNLLKLKLFNLNSLNLCI